MNWTYIMRAGITLDLYGRGHERILVNTFGNIVYYYTLNGKTRLI